MKEKTLLASFGNKNALTDVQGIFVGHHTDEQAASGTTVALCRQGAVAGVEVGGSAPGTRETDLLAPENLVEKVHAVVLSGGSVFGLCAADGVVRFLANEKVGFPLDPDHVAPIVPAAVLFDLGRGKRFTPPVNSEWGGMACKNANSGPVETGCVGAGTGAVAGGIKGGIGTASIVLKSGIIVAALAAVNSHGTLINPETGALWEAGLEMGSEFKGQGGRRVKAPGIGDGRVGQNTTLGIVATDAVITKVMAKKIAKMAHDGMARAVRPAHTLFDGDTVFCMGTGMKPLPDADGFFEGAGAMAINEIGHAAADCLARAMIRGVVDADTRYGVTAFKDLENR